MPEPLAQPLGLKARLDRDGFLQLDGAFPAGELARYDRAATRLIEAGLASPAPGPHYTTLDGGRAIAHVTWPTDLDEAFVPLVDHPSLIAIMNEVAGPDLRLVFCKLVVKFPGLHDTYPWHQDLAYLQLTNDGLFALTLYLDDFTDGQGAMRTIPGSQRLGLLRHDPLGYTDEARHLAPVVEHKVGRGAVTVHHSLTLHDSLPNLSREVRRRAILYYAAADAHARKPPSTHWGRLHDVIVSGVAREARHQDLPYDAMISRKPRAG